MPLPCGSAIPHDESRAHSIYSVTPSAHLHITVPTSAYLPAFPAALASWGIPFLSGMRLTPPPRGEPERVTPFLDVVCRCGRGLTVRRETWWDATRSTPSVSGRRGGAPLMSPCPFWTKPINLRWLVIPNDDSSVSSSAYPLRNSARRDSQVGSA